MTVRILSVRLRLKASAGGETGSAISQAKVAPNRSSAGQQRKLLRWFVMAAFAMFAAVRRRIQAATILQDKLP